MGKKFAKAKKNNDFAFGCFFLKLLTYLVFLYGWSNLFFFKYRKYNNIYNRSIYIIDY